jgi:hypothetical protein
VSATCKCDVTIKCDSETGRYVTVTKCDVIVTMRKVTVTNCDVIETNRDFIVTEWDVTSERDVTIT